MNENFNLSFENGNLNYKDAKGNVFEFKKGYIERFFFDEIIDVSIPSCVNDIPNSSIDRIDLTIPQEFVSDWRVLSLCTWELFDEQEKRINAIPVSIFTINGRTTLAFKMVTIGPNSKNAKRIKCEVLLIPKKFY